MESLLSIENWFTLLMLIALQGVLGLDNLLYISIESKKVAPEHQSMVRRVGLALAVALRLVLLFVLLQAIQLFQEPFLVLNFPGVLEGEVNLHSLIVLVGGGFILYTGIQEIYHLISIVDHEEEAERTRRSVPLALFWIVLMNLVFSFDSILSTIALTDVFWIMAVGIVVTGVGMIFLIDYVADFIDRNRMYQVLGLFVLILVGILLVSEGGHLAELRLFGYEIVEMSQATFYFVMFVMVAVDLVQNRYQKKLMADRRRTQEIVKEVERGGDGRTAAAAHPKQV